MKIGFKLYSNSITNEKLKITIFVIDVDGISKKFQEMFLKFEAELKNEK